MTRFVACELTTTHWFDIAAARRETVVFTGFVMTAPQKQRLLRDHLFLVPELNRVQVRRHLLLFGWGRGLECYQNIARRWCHRTSLEGTQRRIPRPVQCKQSEVKVTTMTRFEYQFPELAAELRRSSVEKRRAAALAACEYAVAQAQIVHPLVMDALSRLRAGEDIGEKRKDLDNLVEQLDQEYFDLADAFREARAGMSDYQKPFAKARAVASLLYAFDPNPYEAASEAIYEAAAVTDEDDPGKLIPAIMAVLT
jgi:hypothetical protein